MYRKYPEYTKRLTVYYHNYTVLNTATSLGFRITHYITIDEEFAAHNYFNTALHILNKSIKVIRYRGHFWCNETIIDFDLTINGLLVKALIANSRN